MWSPNPCLLNSMNISPLSSWCLKLKSVWCQIKFYSFVGILFYFGNVYLDFYRTFLLSLKLWNFEISQHKSTSTRNFTYFSKSSVIYYSRLSLAQVNFLLFSILLIFLLLCSSVILISYTYWVSWIFFLYVLAFLL